VRQVSGNPTPPETSCLVGSSRGRGELEAESGGLLSDELDLLLAVSSFVVFRTFV
jgi:hypothetical protein